MKCLLFTCTIRTYIFLGLCEAYMDGWWDCDQLDELWYRGARKNFHFIRLSPPIRFLNYLQFRVFNMQTKKRALAVAEKHYNLGNELFKTMLDPYMNYSCGYWRT